MPRFPEAYAIGLHDSAPFGARDNRDFGSSLPLIREVQETEAARLMSSTFVLAGLRYEEEANAQLFFGVRSMNLLDSKILKDSSSYRVLQRMFRVDEARNIIISLATRHFGAPTEPQQALLNGIEDYDVLVGLCDRISKVSNWDELLAS